jgi:nitrile hydratase accessory protein
MLTLAAKIQGRFTRFNSAPANSGGQTQTRKTVSFWTFGSLTLNAPDLSQALGIPRDDAGPVFAEPWQAQAFALVLQLHAQGVFTWSEWAQALSARLSAAGAQDDGSRYYEHWLEALEVLATQKALVTANALDARKQDWITAYRQTAHGRPVTLAADA